MVSSKHLKAVTHGIGGFRQPCRHHRHGMAGFVTKAGKCLNELYFLDVSSSLFPFPGLDVDYLVSVICFQTLVFWMYRGFRHGSFDPPVTVWMVSSLQP